MSKPRILFVIAPGGFRDEELFDARDEAEALGAECAVASTRRGTFAGKLGGRAEATLAADEVKENDFDAIAFIGGPGVFEHKLYENASVLKLARNFAAAGKVLGAICVAPRILAAAGLVAGKRVAAFPDAETLAALKRAGVEFTGAACESDGGIVTANGPAAARAFGKALVAACCRA